MESQSNTIHFTIHITNTLISHNRKSLGLHACQRIHLTIPLFCQGSYIFHKAQNMQYFQSFTIRNIGISLLHNAGMEVLKKMQTNIHLQEHLQILLGQHFIFIGQGKFVGGPTNFFWPTNAYKFQRSESHQPLGIQSLHKHRFYFLHL